MKRRVLFIVNGLGLGNSTRCHAVIECLRDMNVDVDVLTSGNGLWYFKNRPEIAALYEMDSLRYVSRKGRLSVWATLLSVPAQLGLLWRKRRRAIEIVRATRPDAVIIDSEYIFFRARILGVPVLALNNADVVCRVFKMAETDVPVSVKAQFYLVEKLDRLYHRLVPVFSLSPCLDERFLSGGKRVESIGPIVRPDLIGGQGAVQANAGGIVIMLSGSVFGTNVSFRKERYPVRIDVIGRTAPEGWTERDDVVFHGRCRDVSAIVRSARLVVVNGGFSAVSEMFCLQKPMLVVPVPRHAEQWLNAYMIKTLGVGDIIAEDEIDRAMLESLARGDEFCDAYSKLVSVPEGAQQAAQRILSFIEKKQ